MSHGDVGNTVDALTALDGDDPEIAFVASGLHEWSEAYDSHCECEAVCECSDA